MSCDPEVLLLGWDRRNITPTDPVPLAGFAARAGLPPASEIAAELHLRTIALRQGEACAVLLVADVLCWGPDNVARVRRDAAQRYGLQPEQLFISATHTHSAPQPSGWFTPGLGLPDHRWVEWLHQQVIDSIGTALEAPRPVTLEWSQGEYELGVERRFVRSSGRERAAELAQRLSVMRLRGSDGTVIASVFHHACHPTVHHANAVSADFPGAAMGSLEASGDAQIALFLQGCCGNINPDRYQGAQFLSGDQQNVESIGEGLAEAVRNLANGEAVATDLSYRHWDTELPTEPAPPTAELENIAGETDLMRSGWARLLLERAERRTRASVSISLLRLGDGVQLIGVSAEVTSPFANHVTDILGERALTLGYCNGMLGYLVTADQLADGGYEATEAPYWFGMPGQLVPEAEQVLRDALVAGN